MWINWSHFFPGLHGTQTGCLPPLRSALSLQACKKQLAWALLPTGGLTLPHLDPFRARGQLGPSPCCPCGPNPDSGTESHEWLCSLPGESLADGGTDGRGGRKRPPERFWEVAVEGSMQEEQMWVRWSKWGCLKLGAPRHTPGVGRMGESERGREWRQMDR